MGKGHFRQRVFINENLHHLLSGEFIVLLSILSPQSECMYMNVGFVCFLSIIPEQVSMMFVFLLIWCLVCWMWENSQHDSFSTTKEINWTDDYISRYGFLMFLLVHRRYRF